MVMSAAANNSLYVKSAKAYDVGAKENQPLPKVECPSQI
jgi:hypothetical protein